MGALGPISPSFLTLFHMGGLLLRGSASPTSLVWPEVTVRLHPVEELQAPDRWVSQNCPEALAAPFPFHLPSSCLKLGQCSEAEWPSFRQGPKPHAKDSRANTNAACKVVTVLNGCESWGLRTSGLLTTSEKCNCCLLKSLQTGFLCVESKQTGNKWLSPYINVRINIYTKILLSYLTKIFKTMK